MSKRMIFVDSLMLGTIFIKIKSNDYGYSDTEPSDVIYRADT